MKLNPMNSPITPPTSATREGKEKANCSLCRRTLLLENITVTFVSLGVRILIGWSAS